MFIYIRYIYLYIIFDEIKFVYTQNTRTRSVGRNDDRLICGVVKTRSQTNNNNDNNTKYKYICTTKTKKLKQKKRRRRNQKSKKIEEKSYKVIKASQI